MTGRTGRYLVVIYALEQADGPHVPTGRIARVVERSPAAATEMVQRLAGDGLVEYERYSGVQLTEPGRDRAADLFGTHQTLCRFFRDVLSLDDYAREALSLAGVVDPEIARRLETTVLPPSDTTPEPVTLLPTLERSAFPQDGERPDTSRHRE